MNKKAIILSVAFLILFSTMVSAHHYQPYNSYTYQNSQTTTTTYSPYGYTTTIQKTVSNPPHYQGSFQPYYSPSQFYGYGYYPSYQGYYYPPHYQYYRINPYYGSYGYNYAPNQLYNYWSYGSPYQW